MLFRSDENSSIDTPLSDADKDTLRLAGNDRLKAVRSGVEYVGVGKGQYIKKDTVIISPASRDSVTFYSFLPEDTLHAVYSITFSYVGAGNGDYNKISLGRYQFVGIKQGSYAPIRFLPMPQSHSLTDFDLTGQAADNIKITGEYAFTNFDANRFSNRDDENNVGSAFKFGLQLTPNNVHVGDKDIGSFDVNLKERFVGKRFVPDRKSVV